MAVIFVNDTIGCDLRSEELAQLVDRRTIAQGPSVQGSDHVSSEHLCEHIYFHIRTDIQYLCVSIGLGCLPEDPTPVFFFRR